MISSSTVASAHPCACRHIQRMHCFSISSAGSSCDVFIFRYPPSVHLAPSAPLSSASHPRCRGRVRPRFLIAGGCSERRAT
eukprot:4761906-Pleurochrysis_carterae.AAC.2